MSGIKGKLLLEFVLIKFLILIITVARHFNVLFASSINIGRSHISSVHSWENCREIFVEEPILRVSLNRPDLA